MRTGGLRRLQGRSAPNDPARPGRCQSNPRSAADRRRTHADATVVRALGQPLEDQARAADGLAVRTFRSKQPPPSRLVSKRGRLGRGSRPASHPDPYATRRHQPHAVAEQQPQRSHRSKRLLTRATTAPSAKLGPRQRANEAHIDRFSSANGSHPRPPRWCPPRTRPRSAAMLIGDCRTAMWMPQPS